MAAATDQARQVVAVLDPARVGGRPGVADQQRPGVAVLQGLRLGLLVGYGAVVVETDVAVGVDEPGDDPALGRGLGPRLGLEGDPPADDVEVANLSVGEHRAAEPLGGATFLNVSRPVVPAPG